MRRVYVEPRIDECPHCGSDEISRIRQRGVYVLSTGYKRRNYTSQDRLYFCLTCHTLIDVRKRAGGNIGTRRIGKGE